MVWEPQMDGWFLRDGDRIALWLRQVKSRGWMVNSLINTHPIHLPVMTVEEAQATALAMYRLGELR